MWYGAYDPEVPRGYQDADIEQAAMEQEGRALDAAKKRGVCTHGGVIGARQPAVYPIQDGLHPGQEACSETGCFVIFDSSDDWTDAAIDSKYRKERELPTCEMPCVHFGGMCVTCGFERPQYVTDDRALELHQQFDPAHEPSWHPSTDDVEFKED